MKLYYRAFLFLFALMAFKPILQAQTECNDVTVSIIEKYPQGGAHNYFGVRVSLVQSYGQDVTVTGYIFDEGSPNTDHPYTLTITAGNLSAETDVAFYRTCPACTAGANFTSVSVCPSTVFWQNELDNIGITHNDAMDFAFNKLQLENLSSITQDSIPRLVASYMSEFITNRYGTLYNLSQNDVYQELLSNPQISAVSYDTLNISNYLKETLTSIDSIFNQASSYESFNSTVISIVNNSINQLDTTEKVILIAYKNIFTKSYEYWEQNLGEWIQLFNTNIASIPTLSSFEGKQKGGSGLNVENEVTTDCILYLNNKLTKKLGPSPCAKLVVASDVTGLIRGAYLGAMSGLFFGFGVGAIPGAILGGSSGAAVGSLGAAVACALFY